jgi:hypothetical protein
MRWLVQLDAAIYEYLRWCPWREAAVPARRVTDQGAKGKIASVTLAFVANAVFMAGSGYISAQLAIAKLEKDIEGFTRYRNEHQSTSAAYIAKIEGNLTETAVLREKIARMETEMRANVDDRYRGSEARRDREAMDRQLAELRERLAALEKRR